MSKLVFLITAGFLLSGCINAVEPTHRWASTEDADRAKYRADHARCQAVNNVAVEGAELDTRSSAFAAYKQCMNDEGYVLTAYNER
jgi:hypothetical protein